MKEFYQGVPEWLRAVKDDDVFSVTMTLLTEWNTQGIKSVENLPKEIKETFPDLSDAQIQEIMSLLIDNKVLVSK